MFRRIDDKLSVAGQIAPEDVAEAAAQGITMIINNRPDGEAPGQPSSAEIAAAAHMAGLVYVHIPVRGGFPADQVAAMADALAGQDQVLAFCAAGTRSTYLWALASIASGEDLELVIGKAAAAGYDLSPLRAYSS